MYTVSEVESVVRLGAEGLSPYAISRTTGIPRSSVMRWLQNPDHALGSRVRQPPRDPSEAPATYAYLLGLYLGDGWMRRYPRTWQLVLTLDARYREVIEDARAAIRTFTPSGVTRVRRRKQCRAVDVSAYGGHWPSLIPQHGPGRKHERTIALAGWQSEITKAHPEQLIRGLIHSDGCRVVARIRSKGKRYRYSRYSFENHSRDICVIFCEHLDLLGIAWTQSRPTTIQIARRGAVAAMDVFVGPKR